MNLLCHLLSRIVAVALLCLLATTAYVLMSSDRDAKQATRRSADSLGKQLSFQQLRMSAGFGDALSFPDFSLWKQTSNTPGVCVRFVVTGSLETHSLCNGVKQATADVPESFEVFYRLFFNPGLTVTQAITFKGRVYGMLTVTPSAEMEIAQAWDSFHYLMGLSVVTVIAVCWLVYLSMRRALRPVQTIVAGLGELEQGQLNYRLPQFALNEWQQIAAAINQLAATQQQLLTERQTLAVQLMNLQEEERRYLARELHDEFGQCLAAINVVVASVAQTATQQCPELVAETLKISRITRHMFDNVRSLLMRLRPAELDELGLAVGLTGLVSGWNTHDRSKIHYRLSISGDCAVLPEPLPVTLFRITQECLTNIAKHSVATYADVTLIVGAEIVTLTITDDGIATRLPFTHHTGIGLLGIRERVTALHGRLSLSITEPHGLRVDVCLPIMQGAGVHI